MGLPREDYRLPGTRYSSDRAQRSTSSARAIALRAASSAWAFALRRWWCATEFCAPAATGRSRAELWCFAPVGVATSRCGKHRWIGHFACAAATGCQRATRAYSGTTTTWPKQTTTHRTGYGPDLAWEGGRVLARSDGRRPARAVLRASATRRQPRPVPEWPVPRWAAPRWPVPRRAVPQRPVTGPSVPRRVQPPLPPVIRLLVGRSPQLPGPEPAWESASVHRTSSCRRDQSGVTVATGERAGDAQLPSHRSRMSSVRSTATGTQRNVLRARPG